MAFGHVCQVDVEQQISIEQDKWLVQMTLGVTHRASCSKEILLTDIGNAYPELPAIAEVALNCLTEMSGQKHKARKATSLAVFNEALEQRLARHIDHRFRAVC